MWCVVLFKQKTAYELRISDWSSDVCSSDLGTWRRCVPELRAGWLEDIPEAQRDDGVCHAVAGGRAQERYCPLDPRTGRDPGYASQSKRSEEHTSELQSLMRISYAVFCLNKKKQ